MVARAVLEPLNPKGLARSCELKNSFEIVLVRRERFALNGKLAGQSVLHALSSGFDHSRVHVW